MDRIAVCALAAITVPLSISAGHLTMTHRNAESVVIDLTAEGKADWISYGKGNASDVGTGDNFIASQHIIRKNNNAGIIEPFSTELLPGESGDFRISGDNSFDRWRNEGVSEFKWSDGTPVESTERCTWGAWARSNPCSFRYRVKANTTGRKIVNYTVIFDGKGYFKVSLSDNSAPAIEDSSYTSACDDCNVYPVYTIKYAADSDTAHLLISYSARTYSAGHGTWVARGLCAATVIDTTIAQSPQTGVVISKGGNPAAQENCQPMYLRLFDLRGALISPKAVDTRRPLTGIVIARSTDGTQSRRLIRNTSMNPYGQ
jgi:hypothetical protein